MARDPAGARSVTRTYPGWSGLKVVATASRTGTGRDQPRCAVVGFSGVIHGPHPMLPFGDIPHRFATTLYKGTVAGVRESALMEFPTRDTMITSATPTCRRVFRYTHGMVWSTCLNRSMCGPAGTLLRAGSAWAYYETTRDEPRAGPDRSSATIATPSATHPSRAPRGLDPWAVCCSGVPT